VPANVEALFEKHDGEEKLLGGWRLHTSKELLELNWEDGWLDQRSAGAYVRRLGGLLPLYTNDNSDIIVLHCGGPLDGRLSYLPHDEDSITLVFHSLAGFLSAREKSGADEVSLGGQYMNGRISEKNQGIVIANQMRKDLGIPNDVNLRFLTHIWERFRGGYPLAKEPQPTTKA
jgi:hypothetical protein